MENDLKNFKMEDDLKDFKTEDDLKIKLLPKENIIQLNTQYNTMQ